jgi:hypothetical protein
MTQVRQPLRETRYTNCTKNLTTDEHRFTEGTETAKYPKLTAEYAEDAEKGIEPQRHGGTEIKELRVES